MSCSRCSCRATTSRRGEEGRLRLLRPADQRATRPCRRSCSRSSRPRSATRTSRRSTSSSRCSSTCMICTTNAADGVHARLRRRGVDGPGVRLRRHARLRRRPELRPAAAGELAVAVVPAPVAGIDSARDGDEGRAARAGAQRPPVPFSVREASYIATVEDEVVVPLADQGPLIPGRPTLRQFADARREDGTRMSASVPVITTTIPVIEAID